MGSELKALRIIITPADLFVRKPTHTQIHTHTHTHTLWPISTSWEAYSASCHLTGAHTLTFHNILHCLLPGTPFTPGWGEENRSKVPFPRTHRRDRDSNTRPHDWESDALSTRPRWLPYMYT